MLQVVLLVPNMDKFEYSDKPLVLWFEKSLQFGKKFFVQARIGGHKCLEIIVISDPVSRRPENLLPFILIFIVSRAKSDTNDVQKDCFRSVLPNPLVRTSLEELIEMYGKRSN